MTVNIHASCVALHEAKESFRTHNAGILLLGPSGAGKSDLALRLIDRGAELVSDDRTMLSVEDGVLTACAASPLQGLLEIRGLGIVRLPYCPSATILLAVQLTAASDVQRLPEHNFYMLPNGVGPLSTPVPLLHLAPGECSTPVKIEAAVKFAVLQGSR